MTEHNDIGLLFDRFAALKTGDTMTQPQLTVGLSGRISVIFRPNTEEEGREIMRAVAAAPELLGVLLKIETALDERVINASKGKSLQDARKITRASIAKAEQAK